MTCWKSITHSTSPADSIITPVSSEADALPDAVPVKKIPKRFVAFPFEVRSTN